MHNSAKIEDHNAILEFLDEHLTKGYTEEVRKRLLARGIKVTKRSIYASKNGERKNWKVLEVLAEIAHENKAAKNKVENILNNN